MKCLLDFCDRAARKNSLCHRHSERKRRGLDGWDQPSVYEMTDAQRFFRNVDRSGGMPDFSDPLIRVTKSDGECWLWTAGILSGDSNGGYGRFKLAGKEWRAHRYSFIYHGGDIEAETVDHLCRRRLCVNPRHLEGVSWRENSIRGAGVCARNARKTHCPNGHELGGANEYEGRGSRSCKACNDARNAHIAKARKNCKNGHAYPEPARRGPSGRRICDACQDVRWTGRVMKRREGDNEGSL